MLKELRNKNLKRFAQLLLIIFVLSDIVLLTMITFIPVSPQLALYIGIFDLMVVLILIPDFIIRFKDAGDKKEFFKHNWIDLLGMVPEIVIGPYATVFRYLRLIRLIKILSLFKMQINQILKFLHKTRIDYGVFVVIIMLISGAIIFYIFEMGHNQSIQGFDDALWYLVVTITTVGYGDISPVTAEGRVIGTLIMITGIGFVSFLTATIASVFVKEDNEEELVKIDEVHQKLDNLKTEIEELKEIIKETHR